MISRADLTRVARARLRDAVVLEKAKRYDGALYLSGYAVEISLEARICKTLRWTGFPETNNEFQNLQSFRTHNFDVLLRLSGVESRIKPALLREWSVMTVWTPDVRYNTVGSVTATDVRSMIAAARTLLGVLV